MKQVTDTGAIEAAVDEIIAANPEQVEKAKANPKLAGWFVGQVIKATGGKANPAAVNALVAQSWGFRWPSIAAARSTMASPSPIPSLAEARAFSRWNSRKTDSRSASGMPGPVSTTSTRTRRPAPEPDQHPTGRSV
jgi:hypothetical protein